MTCEDKIEKEGPKRLDERWTCVITKNGIDSNRRVARAAGDGATVNEGLCFIDAAKRWLLSMH
jgi:hypothetical protein